MTKTTPTLPFSSNLNVLLDKSCSMTKCTTLWDSFRFTPVDACDWTIASSSTPKTFNGGFSLPPSVLLRHGFFLYNTILPLSFELRVEIKMFISWCVFLSFSSLSFFPQFQFYLILLKFELTSSVLAPFLILISDFT